MFILTISNSELFIQFSELMLFIYCPFFGWPHISRLMTPLELKKTINRISATNRNQKKSNTETDQDISEHRHEENIHMNILINRAVY
jgi:hypothetical protein